MAETPEVGVCANAACNVEFRRMGEGKLYVFPVPDPQNWGLPEHMKQKVVWLCGQCSATMYVRLDRRRHLVHVAHRPQHHRRAA